MPAQVSCQDCEGKTALDMCTPGSEAHRVLEAQYSQLEAHAQKMAAELLEECAASAGGGGGGDKVGKGQKGKKKKQAAGKKGKANGDECTNEAGEVRQSKYTCCCRCILWIGGHLVRPETDSCRIAVQHSQMLVVAWELS